jgi:hypothetical protein
MYELVSIKPDDDKKHKMLAVFKNKETGRTKTTHFGAVGYDDYIKTGNKEQRERYLARHKARENWNNPTTAGALSANILWGSSTSIEQNIKAFKKKFKL